MMTLPVGKGCPSCTGQPYCLYPTRIMCPPGEQPPATVRPIRPTHDHGAPPTLRLRPHPWPPEAA